MSNHEFLLLIVLMTLGTVVGRGFFFLFAQSVRMPDWLQHALSFVPAVALAAILAPDLLLSGGVLVEPFVALQPDQLGAVHGGERLGDLGLADAGFAFEQ